MDQLLRFYKDDEYGYLINFNDALNPSKIDKIVRIDIFGSKATEELTLNDDEKRKLVQSLRLFNPDPNPHDNSVGFEEKLLVKLANSLSYSAVKGIKIGKKEIIVGRVKGKGTEIKYNFEDKKVIIIRSDGSEILFVDINEIKNKLNSTTIANILTKNGQKLKDYIDTNNSLPESQVELDNGSPLTVPPSVTTITLNLNGGSIVPGTENEFVQTGTVYTKTMSSGTAFNFTNLPNVEKADHAFGSGWYIDSANNSQKLDNASPNISVTSDITLKPIWLKKFTFTFKSDNATGLILRDLPNSDYTDNVNETFSIKVKELDKFVFPNFGNFDVDLPTNLAAWDNSNSSWNDSSGNNYQAGSTLSIEETTGNKTFTPVVQLVPVPNAQKPGGTPSTEIKITFKPNGGTKGFVFFKPGYRYNSGSNEFETEVKINSKFTFPGDFGMTKLNQKFIGWKDISAPLFDINNTTYQETNGINIGTRTDPLVFEAIWEDKPKVTFELNDGVLTKIPKGYTAYKGTSPTPVPFGTPAQGLINVTKLVTELDDVNFKPSKIGDLNVTKSNFKFDKWDYTISGTPGSYNPATDKSTIPITSDTTFTAAWTQVSYSFEFGMANGKAGSFPKEYKYDKTTGRYKITLDVTEPSFIMPYGFGFKDAGNDFVQWEEVNVNNNSLTTPKFVNPGEIINNKNDSTVLRTRYFKAIYTTPPAGVTYTIKFKSHAIGNPILPEIKVNSGQTFTIPNYTKYLNYDNPGHIFIGWESDEKFVYLPDMTVVGNTDLTLTAKWVKSDVCQIIEGVKGTKHVKVFTVTYDKNDKNDTGLTKSPCDTILQYYNSEDPALPTSFNVPTNLFPKFIRNDHYFEGWSDTANGSGDFYFPGNKIELGTDIILYARWTPKTAAACLPELKEVSGDKEKLASGNIKTITYKSVGSGGPDSLCKTFKYKVDSTVKIKLISTLEFPVPPGKSFVKWKKVNVTDVFYTPKQEVIMNQNYDLEPVFGISSTLDTKIMDYSFVVDKTNKDVLQGLVRKVDNEKIFLYGENTAKDKSNFEVDPDLIYLDYSKLTTLATNIISNFISANGTYYVKTPKDAIALPDGSGIRENILPNGSVIYSPFTSTETDQDVIDEFTSYNFTGIMRLVLGVPNPSGQDKDKVDSYGVTTARTVRTGVRNIMELVKRNNIRRVFLRFTGNNTASFEPVYDDTVTPIKPTLSSYFINVGIVNAIKDNYVSYYGESSLFKTDNRPHYYLSIDDEDIPEYNLLVEDRNLDRSVKSKITVINNNNEIPKYSKAGESNVIVYPVNTDFSSFFIGPDEIMDQNNDNIDTFRSYIDNL